MAPKPLKYPIVEIVWEDIGSPSGWIKPGHDSITTDPVLITSVGYLVMDTQEYIVYASDVANDGDINGRTQVPRSNVKKIKVLRKVKVPREEISTP